MTIKKITRGKGHSYELNGVRSLGVTTAISEGIPKPMLVSWAARTVAEAVADMSPADLEALRGQGRDAMVTALKGIPNKVRNAAAVKGTTIHRYAELLQAGGDLQVEEELVGYVESAARFLDSWRVVPLLAERTVASYRWGYCGSFDLIAELPDGRRPIIDFKSSKSGIYPEVAVQLAAYRFAEVYVADDPEGTEIPMSEVGITDAYAVWLRSDGFDVVPVKADQAAYKLFLHALSVARYRASFSDWVLPAEEAP